MSGTATQAEVVDSVVIWHDAENTILSGRTDGVQLWHTVLDTVRASLSSVDVGVHPNELLLVQWQLVLPASAAHHDLRTGPLYLLNQLGVNHIDPGVKKGACDVKIKSLTNNWVTERTRACVAPKAMARTVAVLLSGDSDFLDEVSRLRRLGVHVVVIYNAANGSKALSTCATVVVPEWQRILSDSADHSRRCSSRSTSPSSSVRGDRGSDKVVLERLHDLLRQEGSRGLLGSAIPPSYQAAHSETFPMKVADAIQKLRKLGKRVEYTQHGMDKRYYLVKRRGRASRTGRLLRVSAGSGSSGSDSDSASPSSSGSTSPPRTQRRSMSPPEVAVPGRDVALRELDELVCDAGVPGLLGSTIPRLFKERFGYDLKAAIAPMKIRQVAQEQGWSQSASGMDSWYSAPVVATSSCCSEDSNESGAAAEVSLGHEDEDCGDGDDGDDDDDDDSSCSSSSSSGDTAGEGACDGCSVPESAASPSPMPPAGLMTSKLSAFASTWISSQKALPELPATIAEVREVTAAAAPLPPPPPPATAADQAAVAFASKQASPRVAAAVPLARRYGTISALNAIVLENKGGVTDTQLYQLYQQKHGESFDAGLGDWDLRKVAQEVGWEATWDCQCREYRSSTSVKISSAVALSLQKALSMPP